jgi:predicted transcriptional regulator
MSKQPCHKIKEDRPSGLEKFLGALELVVMEAVWQREWASVWDVLEILNRQGRNLAYTTVMTILNRLKKKGWLTTIKAGRAYLYQAARSRQEAEAEAVGSVMRALLQDFGEIAIAQFVRELDEIDPEQLNRLAELAQQAGREKNE